MVHIKKMVMHGFKSFAQKTEIVFDKGINVILGPNGSGKSNISDALCFVLGRLSIKSMRAAKAKNLIFMGSKYVKPHHEASVKLYLDNSDRAFAIDKDEIVIERTVRYNGQSTYKINGEVKTRTEVIEMLAQAGIDPHGFNIILQGEIHSIVRMHSEDRRKIIEEVAGISIYESRKEKSLKELEKTEEKLREISTILRERTAFLKNLEREKAQAEKYQELEKTISRAKATILFKKAEEKNKELNSLNKSISEKENQKGVLKERAEKSKSEIIDLEEKINQINKHIRQATGVEQEKLHMQIANLRVEIEGLKVRKENYENKKSEIERRIREMAKSIPSIENEIAELREKSPIIAKKAQDIKRKKEELAAIEEERKALITLKSELNSLRQRISEKEREYTKITAESESVFKQIENISATFAYSDETECNKALQKLKINLEENKKSVKTLSTKEIENIKKISIADVDITNSLKIKNDVSKIDICPLCQSKITEEHISHVKEDCDKKIKNAKGLIANAEKELEEITKQKSNLLGQIEKIEEKISCAETEMHNHLLVKEKKEQLARFLEQEKILKTEIENLENKKKNLENKSDNLHQIEERYHSKILEIEEISSRTEEDIDTTLLYKEREIENINNIIKRSKGDIEEISALIKEISQTLNTKLKMLEQKEVQEKELNDKFNRMFSERDEMQKKIQEKNLALSALMSEIRQIEEQINYLMIGRAKIEAEKSTLELELKDYAGIELLQGSIQTIEEKMKRAQESLIQIGSINMRALEVYEEVKKEYDAVQEKVNTLEREKMEIMKIIEEIDRKKSKSFMKTFRAINELFSNNFSKLSSKGTAFLELENKENIFEGGVNIIVRLAKGKYFDVTSLSGGEQTLVALSLLFAIQEHKPYHFYLFDEIDAALDKRNSERLASLLNQYMKAGQYIVISHNDAIIMNSNILYGVSMHEGVSKILSLQVNGPETPVNVTNPINETKNENRIE